MNIKKTKTSFLLFLIPLILFLFYQFQTATLNTDVSPNADTKQSITNSGEMKVHFIDVGQGDCELIESDGHYMLIDAGENDKGDLVISYLKSLGIKKLDYVIGTHPHSDHIGGLDQVIQEFDIGKVILPPKEHTTKTFEDVLDAIAEKGLKITKPVPGTAYSLGNASFTIIAPNADYQNQLNNWSVGIRLTNGNNHFILSGDAESASEQDMVLSGIELQADVLKLNHHGSRTSSSDEFLDAVNPEFAVISCGKNNTYGHPHQEILHRINARKIEIYRTDLQGTIIAVSDGQHITWKSSLSPATERISIQEDTQSYVLNISKKIFHQTNCSSVSQMKESNKQLVTESRDTLIQEGYIPCKNCNP